eukprot:3109398-Prorocentrum_lima.AAC.1
MLPAVHQDCSPMAGSRAAYPPASASQAPIRVPVWPRLPFPQPVWALPWARPPGGWLVCKSCAPAPTKSVPQWSRAAKPE